MKEIEELAKKLQNQGIARTWMDALRMAENMLSIKITQNTKTKIDNISYDEEISDIKHNKISENIIEKSKVLTEEIKPTFNEERNHELKNTSQVVNEIEREETDDEIIKEEINEIEEEKNEEQQIVESQLEEPKIIQEEKEIEREETDDEIIKEEINEIEEGKELEQATNYLNTEISEGVFENNNQDFLNNEKELEVIDGNLNIKEEKDSNLNKTNSQNLDIEINHDNDIEITGENQEITENKEDTKILEESEKTEENLVEQNSIQENSQQKQNYDFELESQTSNISKITESSEELEEKKINTENENDITNLF